MIELTIQKREKTDTLDAVRAAGMVPAVFYGPKEASVAISLNAKDFYKAWKNAGESTILVLKGIGDDKEVLIQEVSVHPVSGEVLHVDFYAIEKGKKLTVSIPFEFTGEAPAEKLGGIVVKVMHEAELEVRPSALPQSIEVDLTQLTDMDSRITLADLSIPEDSAFTATDADEVVASIAVQKEEEEEVVDTPEVETDTQAPTEDSAKEEQTAE